jgi:glycerol uptake facilitator protein
MFLGEVVGTCLLVLLGDGVVAGVLLNKSKAQNSGWVVITVTVIVPIRVVIVAARNGVNSW